MPNLWRMVPPFPLATEMDTCGVSGWWKSVNCGVLGLWDRGCSIMVILSQPSCGQRCQAFLRDFPHGFPVPSTRVLCVPSSFWTFAISVSLLQQYILPQIPLDGSLHNISNPRPLAPSHLLCCRPKTIDMLSEIHSWLRCSCNSFQFTVSFSINKHYHYSAGMR